MVVIQQWNNVMLHITVRSLDIMAGNTTMSQDVSIEKLQLRVLSLGAHVVVRAWDDLLHLVGDPALFTGDSFIAVMSLSPLL